MLRPYQQQAVVEVYAQLRLVDRVGLQMPTGSGKTHVAMAIIKHGLKHDKRICFIADRLTLIDQTYDRFFDEGIPTGVIQADHPMWNPAKPVQVCSVQTLARRNFPEADLYIVDEFHDQYTATYEAMALHGKKWIGLSATPFTTGLGNYWQALVVATTTAGLIDEGYLCPYVAYGPTEPDMKGAKTVAGDYQKSDSHKRMTVLSGGIVDNYINRCDGMKAMCFTVNVAHAKELAVAFEQRGIKADYVCGRDDRERRHAVLAAFEAREIDVLLNCAVMTKGADVPDLEVVILARPTRSLALHIQMLGRGLRTSAGKKRCVFLDHAGNITRLGFPDDPLPTTLCTKKKGVSTQDKREKKDPIPWKCPKCTHLLPQDAYECHICGYKRERKSDVEEMKGTLGRIYKTTKADKQAVYSQLLCHAQGRGYSTGWAAHKYKEIFGVWPRKLKKTLITPTPEIRSWLKAQQIRWAKRPRSNV